MGERQTTFEETVHPERLEKWRAALLEVDGLRDGLRKPVDSGIKEAVTAFRVNGFLTTGSCEGHLGWAYPHPYIQVEHTLDTPEFKKKIELLIKLVREKKYESINHIPESDTELHLKFLELKRVYEEHSKNIEQKLLSLFDEFYSHHAASSSDFVLKAFRGGSFFVIEPASGAGTGKKNKDEFKAKVERMSLLEKEEYLRLSQNEMQAFAEFLKDKFLTGDEV